MRVRASWVIVVGVVAVMLLRADLRYQARLMLTPHKLLVETVPALEPGDKPERLLLLASNEEPHQFKGAREFVRQKASHDPEMLLAEALGTSDSERKDQGFAPLGRGRPLRSRVGLLLHEPSSGIAEIRVPGHLWRRSNGPQKHRRKPEDLAQRKEAGSPVRRAGGSGADRAAFLGGG